MPIARYGLLVGRPLHGVPGRGTNAHYQIHVVDDVTEYRIAVRKSIVPNGDDVSSLLTRFPYSSQYPGSKNVVDIE